MTNIVITNIVVALVAVMLATSPARWCGLLGFPFRSKSDSRLLLGGSLGCDGAVGFERRGVGADGSVDPWST